MEKIAIGNGAEIPYDNIGFKEGCLVLGFTDGDAAALELVFKNAGQDNLEVIRQYDAEGNMCMVHERYDIFKAVNKQIGAAEKADVVEIVLAPETEIEARIRHLEKEMRDTKDVTTMLLMSDLEEV